MKTDRKIKAKKSSPKLKADTKVRRGVSEPARFNGNHPLTTYEHAPVGIVECSPAGKHINLNEEYCRITGYEKAELLGCGIKDFTHEEDYPIDIKLHEQLVAGEIPFYRLEKRYVRKDGSIVWVELTRSVVRDADEKPLYTMGVVIDISERKHVERVLHESVERLRLATEAAHMFMWEWDFQNQIYTLADNFEQVLGFSTDLLPKNKFETLQRLVPTEDVQAVSEAFEKATENHSDLHSLPCRVINPESDQTVWLEVSAKIVYDHEKKPERMFGVAQNITESKRAEQSLTEFARQQEALYQLADHLHRMNSLEDACNAALDAILNALQCARASILLFDDTNMMRFVAWRGLSDDYRKATDGHSPWKPDAKNPEPICINDIGAAELSDSLKAVIKGEGIGSLAFIPLVSNGKLIGKLMVYFNVAHIFSEGELDLSLTIAHQLAFGIERKQAEEALRQSEERFAWFMQHLPGLAWIKDIQGHYIYANAAAEKAFKTPRAGLYGKTDQDIFPPEVAAQFKMNDERALTDGRGVQVIETLKHDDGVLHYSLVSKFPIPGPNGDTALIGGTAFDITEGKRAEEALRASEERYRGLFDLVPIAVYTCDANGLIQEYNHRAVELWGREPEKNNPKEKYCGSFKIYYPDGRFMPHEECPMSRILHGEVLEPHELEILVERQDGVRRNVIAHPLPLKNERGEIIEAINCLYDITERKQAEEALQQLNLQLESRVQKRTATIQAINQSLRNEIAERERAEESLRESEATARLLLNTAPDGVVIADGTGVIVHVNAQIASLFGYEPHEVLGKQIEVLIPERFRDRHIQHRRTYHDQRRKRVMGLGMDLFGRHKNGYEFPVDVMLTPILNITGWDMMVTIRDSTERKEMESALRKSHEHLRILSQRLVEVQEEERRALARELHDRVGQTLAALNINLIIIRGQLSADVTQQIGTRLNDSMKLVAETIALVRDVMTDLRPAVLDDYGLEAALESHLAQFISRYNVNAKLKQPDRPIPRMGPSIEMTFMRIAQEALMNIARHAHADEVNLTLWQDGHSVSLTIQDNGIGIESWQEANRPGSHGLTIMRERAEAFGGSLRVKSVPGQGTKVEVSIPLMRQNEAREEKHL